MTETWVFDASPLSAFASGQLLGVLRILAGERRTVITGEVEAELRAGLAEVPQLNDVLQAAWLERVDTLEATGAHRMFGAFAERLVGATQRNLGEATVLTWAATHTVPTRSSTMQSLERLHGSTASPASARSAFSSRLSAPGRSASKWPPAWPTSTSRPMGDCPSSLADS